ncbi:MAG: HD family phosphohydrolase [Candidatus Krumholzibacteriia bacterium]
MKIVPWNILRRRKNHSRTRRAWRFTRHLRLKRDVYKGLSPRAGLLLAFVAATILLFPPSKRGQEVIFKAGEIADRDIIAPFDFDVPRSAEALSFERAQAATKVPPVYVKDNTVERDLAAGLQSLLDSVSIIIHADSLTKEAKLTATAELVPDLSPKMVREFIGSTAFSRVAKAAVESQKKIFEAGLLDNAGPLRRRSVTSITVLDGGDESLMPVRNIVDQGEVDQVIRRQGFSKFPKDRTRAQVFYEIVRGHALPNLMLDEAETEKRRTEAVNKVTKTIRVSKNQRIIGNHDKVTVEQEKMLAALEEARASSETEQSPLLVLLLYTAEVLRLLAFGLLFGGYIFVFHRAVYRDMLKLVTVLSVLLIYLVFVAVVVRFALSQYLVPVAFVAMMMTALFSYRMGLVTTVFACFILPLVTSLPAELTFVSLLAGSMAVLGLLRMRSRSHFYSAFLLVVAAYVVGVLGSELGQMESFSDLSRELLWSLGNGLFSTLSAMFLLPIFEGVFNTTTRFTLLELTDLNKPILKRLNMEAPGTYHHSMLLGSLVDAVAADVGADPLKARVMAYYHDIGKIFKPEYYVENQESGFNKHEKITPKMSSLILLSHVKDGVELAREEKLPDMIINAIKQHHGTTVMAFFYQKALETDSHSSVNKDDFRYPGPRPQSKEAAVLMLADTVEPACRSIADPTPAHVRNMVSKLITTRAQDGELDDSGLTLNDLATIREKFTSILTGIYHKRVAYPGQDKEEDEGREAVIKPVASK